MSASSRGWNAGRPDLSRQLVTVRPVREFRGKVAAVTGAGSGIGQALAEELARRGCDLSLSDVDEEGLAETVLRCEQAGVTVRPAQLDVADRDAVFAWADTVVADHGKVNLIANNAGVALGATAAAQSIEDFEWLMNVNFWGVVHGTQAFLPHLRTSGDGHIVNISSVSAQRNNTGVYGATKHAVNVISSSLREELEEDTIRVTNVMPGAIATNFARNFDRDFVNQILKMAGMDIEVQAGEHLPHAVLETLQQNGIEIPFPQREVRMIYADGEQQH